MSHKVNLVRVFTTATGNSTPITLGAAYSQLFMTPAEAGAMDGRVYTYLIVDGNDWEMGRGAYTASGTSLARTTIIASRISGTLGTSRITLTGTAQVRFIEAAEDMDGVRGTRPVTSTSDVLANSDQGYVVTYNNSSAIAVSLAQAGSSNLFLAGWATMVQNIGSSTVTITPSTSTINGASTLALASGMGAFIWSDGTNYRAYFIPASKPLLAANNLSDGTAATMLTNLGGTTVGKAVFVATNAAAARTATGAAGTAVANDFTDATEATGAGTTASAIFRGGVEIVKKLFVTGAAQFNSFLQVGTGTLVNDPAIGSPRFQAFGASGGYGAAVFQMSGASDPYVSFYRSGVGVVGSVNGNGGTGVTYATTSDYRLKCNLTPLIGATDRVKALQVYNGSWLERQDRSEDMMLAHEIAEVVPAAVLGEKDAEKGGKPIYQTVDYSRLVPLLVAALSEAIARIEALEENA